jgi:hypothetical protein
MLIQYASMLSLCQDIPSLDGCSWSLHGGPQIKSVPSVSSTLALIPRPCLGQICDPQPQSPYNEVAIHVAQTLSVKGKNKGFCGSRLLLMSAEIGVGEVYN